MKAPLIPKFSARRGLPAPFAALILGGIWSTGFAPLSLPLAAFAALCAGILLMAGTERIRQAVFIGGLFAFGAFLPGLSWTVRSMHEFGRLPLPLAVLALMALAAFCALFWGASAGIAARFFRPGAARAFALAGLLTLAEWLRGPGLADFGWLTPAFATLDTPFSALAPLGGEHLVNLALLSCCAAVASLLIRPVRTEAATRIAAVAAVAVVVASAGIGFFTAWSEQGVAVSVRLVQADLPVVDGWTRAPVSERIRRAAALMDRPWPEGAAEARVTLTPEGIITSDILRLPKAAQGALETFIEAARGPVLFSAFRRDEAGGWRNSAFLVRDGAFTLTDKRKLVPFGEYVPAGFRWFVDAMRIPLSDQTPGGPGQENPLVAPDVRAGVLICYENIDGEEARGLWQAPEPPDLILITSNLGWFGDAVRAQHLDMTRFLARAVARPVASVSMNGRSALVDARGRLTAEASETGVDLLVATLQTATGEATPFVRYGSLPALLLACLLVTGAAAGEMLRRRQDGRE